MRICIFGAGAIGGFLGAELALAGEDVTLVARGPHLAAMQANGLTLVRDGQTKVAKVRAVATAAEAGPQDYVFITLKSHAVAGVVEDLKPLFGPETAVVWGVNGVPWWYFHGVDGALRDRQLESVDPGGVQWRGIGPERVIGCVVYPACEVSEPGVVQHIDGDRFTLGEPTGEKTARATALSEAMIKAGLKAPVRPRIRDEIWVKLWGNLCFNPISALTHATLDVIATDPGTRAVARAMMLEAQAIGEKLGVKFGIDVDKRIAGAAAVGAHKTSMLQDLERSRPMEIDALVSAVQELGMLVEVPTPAVDIVLALIRQRARVAGLYS
ncbi:MAG TPA: 2-dehydropantoate 2-reductase [Alphaproteobacteria bacterium]